MGNRLKCSVNVTEVMGLGPCFLIGINLASLPLFLSISESVFSSFPPISKQYVHPVIAQAQPSCLPMNILALTVTFSMDNSTD